MKKLSMFTWVIMLAMMVTLFVTCKKDESEPDVLAGFTYVVDGSNFRTIIFTNTSSNFSTLQWNFGDGETSTETNPTHTFAELKEYTVKLTATSKSGSKIDEYSTVITISDPNAELTKLVGDVSKTWKLLRVTTDGRYPLEVGPIDHSSIWWAVASSHPGWEDPANRACMLNDSWTFGRDGSMVYDTDGDYWKESGIFANPSNICQNTGTDMVGVDGEDLSAWGDGNHSFRLDLTPTMKLTALGRGAYIGFFKSATTVEVTKYIPTNNMMQDSVTYDVIKLTDDAVDTLIIEANFLFNLGDPTPGGYWRYVLVHYDDPNEEPPIPAYAPVASFTYLTDGLTVSISNSSQYGETYAWDFGDGGTSVDENPVHTYAADGIYLISLTVTNNAGTGTTSYYTAVSSLPLTDEMLQGNPWKVRVEANSVFVGPQMGNHTWWQVPLEGLNGTTTGEGDWSCMTDDEFTFGPGNKYTYAGKGLVRNDGYFGTPQGCWEETALTGNALYFASGEHTYAFTPATATTRPIILLTNGPDRAAFIGFYKGYYGGENTSIDNPPNGGNATNQYEVMGFAAFGGKQYLFVTVDLDGAGPNTSSWSTILVR